MTHKKFLFHSLPILCCIYIIVCILLSSNVLADSEYTPEESELFQTLSTSDTGQQIAEKLSVKVLEKVLDGNAEQATRFYGKLLEVRPDPSFENDELRKQVVHYGKSPEIKGFVEARFQELSLKNEGIFESLRLQYLRSPTTVIGVVAICILVSVLVLLILLRLEKQRIKRKTALENKPKPKEPNVENRKDRNSPGYFVNRNSSSKSADQDDEYSKLLGLFELTDKASEADIKHAYRKKMKELHPDRSQDRTPEQIEKFNDLQNAYERIIEVRKSWFGSMRRR
jgi:hypothetical protein